jgi:iron(III) transport system substrate-binding protein
MRLLCLLLAAALLVGCTPDPDLTVYCSLDQEFGEPLIRRFEAESGLKVRAEFDIEANKNIGLSMRIREERSRPRCDVFWSNEFAQVVSMGQDGLLASYHSQSAQDIPPTFKDEQGRWTGFAARARIFIVNTQLVDPAQVQDAWSLFDPRFEGKAALARPLAGTTLTHLAALYEGWGEERGLDYARTAATRARSGALNLANGNAHVMRLVRSGEAAFGWTDTDDFEVARREGWPVAAVYPDKDKQGTLLIPNTVCILQSAPHPEAARRFVDWVLRGEIEAELAASRSAQIPVRASVPRPAHVLDASQFKAMQVDYNVVGARIQQRLREFQELFLK